MTLTNISPIDGRYAAKVIELEEYFSEYALMKYRIKVEIEYFIALSEQGLFKLSNKNKLREIYQKFKPSDAKKVKDIEKTTNHDVKAIEYYIKSKMKGNKNLEFIHFALTSEDINNLSYSLMLKDGMAPLFDVYSQLYNRLIDFSKEYSDIPMLSRTHGQPASPTTLGKEFRIYCDRLDKMVESMINTQITGKLNGASGNYNAHTIAYPKIDWLKFSEKFISNLGLEPNLITYQIEPHDTIAVVYHAITRINNVIVNLNQDLWTYISMEYIGQKAIKGEIGSSAMPHKVNPIDFENSEGNLLLANSMFEFLARKLPVTRLQRDLTDSTVLRNQGTAIAYSLIGVKSTLKGLSKIKANEIKIIADLENHPEIIAEAIQTVLRREKAEMPYEKLMDLTRGKKVTFEDFRVFIDNLKVSQKIKNELHKITPTNYLGQATKLANR